MVAVWLALPLVRWTDGTTEVAQQDQVLVLAQLGLGAQWVLPVWVQVQVPEEQQAWVQPEEVE